MPIVSVKIPANAKFSSHPQLKVFRVKIARRTSWDILWAVLRASRLDLSFLDSHDVRVYEKHVDFAYGQGLTFKYVD